MRTKILFICDYGQSRSVYFANRLKELNIQAQYCGLCNEADVKLDKALIEWSNNIVMLSSSYEYIPEVREMLSDKSIIEYYIDDEPSNFSNKFDEFIKML